MNRLLRFLLIVPVILLFSCDPQEPRDVTKEIKATVQEIQGSWLTSNNAYNYFVTFNQTAYMIEMLNVFTEDPIGGVSGVFVYEDGKLILEPQYSYGDEINVTTLEVYWKDKEKTILQILPLGTFERQ